MQQFERCIGMYKELGDEWNAAHVGHRLAVTFLERGEWGRGRELLDETLRRAEASGWSLVECEATGSLASVELQEGNLERAAVLGRRNLDLSRELGVDWFQTFALLTLAEIALASDEPDEAARHAGEALAISRQLDNRQESIFAIAILALAARARGDDEHAGWLWGVIEAEEARGPLGRWEALYRAEYGAEAASCGRHGVRARPGGGQRNVARTRP